MVEDERSPETREKHETMGSSGGLGGSPKGSEPYHPNRSPLYNLGARVLVTIRAGALANP